MSFRPNSRSNPPDRTILVRDLRAAYRALTAAHSRLNEVTDPDAVDATVFELAAIERRIRLLRRLLASGVSLE